MRSDSSGSCRRRGDRPRNRRGSNDGALSMQLIGPGSQGEAPRMRLKYKAKTFSRLWFSRTHTEQAIKRKKNKKNEQKKTYSSCLVKAGEPRRPPARFYNYICFLCDRMRRWENSGASEVRRVGKKRKKKTTTKRPGLELFPRVTLRDVYWHVERERKKQTGRGKKKTPSYMWL